MYRALLLLDRFQSLQRDILEQVMPFVGAGGRLIYMTCSVFAAENADQVAWAQQNLAGFILERSNFLPMASGNDGMFFAEFRKA